MFVSCSVAELFMIHTNHKNASSNIQQPRTHTHWQLSQQTHTLWSNDPAHHSKCTCSVAQYIGSVGCAALQAHVGNWAWWDHWCPATDQGCTVVGAVCVWLCGDSASPHPQALIQDDCHPQMGCRRRAVWLAAIPYSGQVATQEYPEERPRRKWTCGASLWFIIASVSFPQLTSQYSSLLPAIEKAGSFNFMNVTAEAGASFAQSQRYLYRTNQSSQPQWVVTLSETNFSCIKFMYASFLQSRRFSHCDKLPTRQKSKSHTDSALQKIIDVEMLTILDCLGNNRHPWGKLET